MTTLLGGLFSQEVSVVEIMGVPPTAALFREEEDGVATAVEQRRREFAAVRWCARLALLRRGLTVQAIPADLGAAEPWGRRAPVWPAGVVGSMTHCQGYYAAAVAPRVSVLSLGIDAEPATSLPDSILEKVALPQEIALNARRASSAPGICWDRLLFSAKETVFKAWYPVTRAWLGFEECFVELGEDGTFEATVLKPSSGETAAWPKTLAGRWAVGDTHLATAVELRSAHPTGT